MRVDLEYAIVIDDLIQYKCLCYNKNYQEKFDKNVSNFIKHTYTFSNQDINKFILLLRIGVSPIWIHIWLGEFHETSLTEKEYSYSPWNIWKILLIQGVHRHCKSF